MVDEEQSGPTMHGLVACHFDSYKTTSTAKVLSCTPSKVKDGATKGKKKGKKAPKTFDVVLDETILFPEGGGQPTDYGKLDNLNVSNVGHDETGTVIHTVSGELPVGKEVAVSVDWNRRYDHMQHHTGQHLISAIAREMGFNTMSWWLSGYPELCNIELDQKEISPEQLAQLEQRVNQIIREAHQMTSHVIDMPLPAERVGDYPTFPSPLLTMAQGGQGQLRVVEIEGVEHNKCCGTHLKNTAELQTVVIPKADKVKGHCRIYFMTGSRVLANLTRTLSTEKQLAVLLCGAPDTHVDLITKSQAEARTSRQKIKKLTKDLSEAVVVQMISSSKPYILYSCEETEMSFLDALAAELKEKAPERLCVLTATTKIGSKEGNFIVCGPEEPVTFLGKELCALLQGKGGGRKGKFQGKGKAFDNLEQVEGLLQKYAPVLEEKSLPSAAAADSSSDSSSPEVSSAVLGRLESNAEEAEKRLAVLTAKLQALEKLFNQ